MKLLLKVLIVLVLIIMVYCMAVFQGAENNPVKMLLEPVDTTQLKDTVFIDTAIIDTVYVEMQDTIGTDTQFIND